MSYSNHQRRATQLLTYTTSDIYYDCWYTATARVQHTATCTLLEYSNWQRASVQRTVRVQQPTAYNNMTTCIRLRTAYMPGYSELPAYSNATTRVQQSAAYNDVIASVERHDEMRLPKSSNWQHTTT